MFKSMPESMPDVMNYDYVMLTSEQFSFICSVIIIIVVFVVFWLEAIEAFMQYSSDKADPKITNFLKPLFIKIESRTPKVLSFSLELIIQGFYSLLTFYMPAMLMFIVALIVLLQWSK